MNLFKRIALAVNQSVCLICTGRNDLTLSARAQIKYLEQGKSAWRTSVNGLFFWQKDHCKSALRWELKSASDMYHRYKHLL